MILHIAEGRAWDAACVAGRPYEPAGLAVEGFVHCSTPSQLVATAARYYPDPAGRVVLHLDPSRLTAEVRWEVATGGERFAHVYGPIDLDAVTRVEALADALGAANPG